MPAKAAITALSEPLRERLLQRLRSEYASAQGASKEAAAFAHSTKLAVYLTLEENSPPQDQETLEQRLRERLPDYMVPHSIRILDKLPTTSNGKIDKTALSHLPAELDRPRPLSPPPADGPTQSLLAIWEGALGVRPVRETDDFFALGGDSILAIQVVSEARKAGFPLSVSQLFKHSTVQGLVSCLASQPSVQRVPPAIIADPTGDLGIPFTPIQQWFFENRCFNQHHWNQSFLLHLDARIPFSSVEQAFRRLYESHEALRLVIQERPTCLVQTVQDTASINLPIQHWPIRLEELQESQDEAGIIRQTANAIQTNLRLSEGRLLRACFFSAANGEPNKLLLIAHHLAVDAVSWRIIFDELAGQLTSTSNSKPLNSTIAPDRFSRWALALPQAARAVESSLGFWRNQLYHRCPSIPLDHGELSLNLEKSTRTVSFTLSARQTQALLAKASTRENSVQTFLVASLGITLRQWLGSPGVLIGIEGHGRQDAVPGANSAGMVGWLTSYFPVVLDLQYADTPEQALADVRWQLAQVPDDGRSYGLLRYCHPDPAVRQQLAAVPKTEVTFNYLGKAAGPSVKAPLLAVEYGIGVDRDPENRRTSIFEINAGMLGDCLKIDWQYSEAIHNPQTIDNLAQVFAATLDRLTCASRPAPYPASDAAPDAERCLELTAGQEALLLHRLGNPDHDLGELTLSGDLVGSTCPNRIEAAWNEMVACHPALRATAHWSDNAAPVLKIHRTSRQSIESIDLSELSGAEQERVFSQWAGQKEREALDIRKLPTTRLALAKRSDDRYSFVWRCHHLFLDGWSSSLLLKEWLERLSARPETAGDRPDATAAFYEYHSWLASMPPSEAGRFWSADVQSCEPCHIIEKTGQGPATGFQKRSTIAYVPKQFDLSTLRSAAADYRATPSALALAAWGIVLANLTQRNSVCFGLTHSGRNVPIPNPETIVGNLANLVPFRTHCDPEANLPAWIRHLMEQQERVSRHGHVSLFRIARWTPKQLIVPLFDTTLTIANYPRVDATGAVRLEGFAGDTTSAYPVSVSLSLSDSFSVAIDYDERVLSSDAARFLATVYTRTLARLCQEPALRLGSLLEPAIASEFRQWTATAPPAAQPHASAAGLEPGGLEQPQGPATSAERLVALFRETLSRPDAGVHDSFFDLGGTSLQAVRLFNAIERVYHQRLPLSSLFQHPSAASLAVLLGSATHHCQPFRSLVEIRRGDDRLPPLFLIHAGGLEVLFYKELADHLDADLPLYGVRSVGLDRRERPLDDIGEIARRYLQEVQGVHPKGPYFILGHCYGVTVALEMAAQLRRRNFDVPLIISVDGPALRTSLRFERPAAPAKRPFLLRVIGKLRREFAYYRARPEGRRKLLGHWIQSAYVRAVRRYRAERYLGRVLHLKCTDAETIPNQSDLAWQQAVPNVQIQYLDCTHGEVLHSPHVTTVADAILRELNACYYSGALQGPRPSARPDQR